MRQGNAKFHHWSWALKKKNSYKASSTTVSRWWLKMIKKWNKYIILDHIFPCKSFILTCTYNMNKLLCHKLYGGNSQSLHMENRGHSSVKACRSAWDLHCIVKYSMHNKMQGKKKCFYMQVEKKCFYISFWLSNSVASLPCKRSPD